MKVSTIVPAAGLGLRLKSNIAKPLALINDESIIIHTLRKLENHPLINEIILVFNSKDISEVKELIKEKEIKKVKEVIEGGLTRRESVKNGLRCLGDTDLVLIHDGARPFIEEKIITNVINSALKYGAAVVGIPLKSTIKRIKSINNLEVDCTLRRDEIWEIQTPQVFRKDLISRAYDSIDETEAPDDSFLVERLGERVVLIEGSSINIKITTPEDLLLAQAIAGLKK